MGSPSVKVDAATYCAADRQAIGGARVFGPRRIERNGHEPADVRVAATAADFDRAAGGPLVV